MKERMRSLMRSLMRSFASRMRSFDALSSFSDASLFSQESASKERMGKAKERIKERMKERMRSFDFFLKSTALFWVARDGYCYEHGYGYEHG
eukprot:gene9317-biopygen4262